MANSTFTRTLNSETQSAAFARRVAARLSSGHTLLLEGPVGAGKTHFARSAIKSLLLDDEDVPSPTFTLVQTYDSTAGPIWHADLYRLTSDFEVEELGLMDAMEDAICLIEWPDRLGSLMPADAAVLAFTPDPKDENKRSLTATWSGATWDSVFKGLAND